MERAVVRLVLVVLCLAGVLVTATMVGLPAAAVMGLAITMAGLVGIVGLARRGANQGSSTATPMMPAPFRLAAEDAPRADVTGRTDLEPGAENAPRFEAERRTDVASGDPDGASDPVVAAMAPDAMFDPESLMPRWRRPSLLAARHADPMRVARVERTPMRFGPGADPSPNRRVVRYAVVSLLDRPDELGGRQVSDLMAGDEVEVLDSGGAFWEVLCPDGLRGWVHRTTLGLPGAAHLASGRREATSDADDILTAVLSARGIR